MLLMNLLCKSELYSKFNGVPVQIMSFSAGPFEVDSSNKIFFSKPI